MLFIIGPFASFSLCSSFQCSWKYKGNIKIAYDWIRTACRKQPLYQLSHNHFPEVLSRPKCLPSHRCSPAPASGSFPSERLTASLTSSPWAQCGRRTTAKQSEGPGFETLPSSRVEAFARVCKLWKGSEHETEVFKRIPDHTKGIGQLLLIVFGILFNSTYLYSTFSEQNNLYLKEQYTKSHF